MAMSHTGSMSASSGHDEKRSTRLGRTRYKEAAVTASAAARLINTPRFTPTGASHHLRPFARMPGPPQRWCRRTPPTEARTLGRRSSYPPVGGMPASFPIVVRAPLRTGYVDGSLSAAAKGDMAGDAAEPERSNK